jgi:hypothetical protein
MGDRANELVFDVSMKRVFKSWMRSFCLHSFGIWACTSSSRVVTRNLANSSTPLKFSICKSTSTTVLQKVLFSNSAQFHLDQNPLFP